MATNRLTDLTAFSGTTIQDEDEFWSDIYNSETCTITSATEGVITITSHGLVAGNIVQFTTTGALPTNITASTDYYVVSDNLTANDFSISATKGGTPIDTTSGTQSGVQTCVYYVSRKMSGLKLKSILANQSYSATFTPTTAGSANTISHNLNSTDVVVELWDIDTDEQIIANIGNRSINALDVTFTSNPSGDVRVVVVANGSNTLDPRTYTVLTGLLTQTATSAPTLTILENTLGETPVPSYTSAGNYALDFSVITLSSSTLVVFLGDTIEAPKKLIGKYGSSTSVLLRSMNGATYTDGYLSNTPIEIRIY